MANGNLATLAPHKAGDFVYSRTYTQHENGLRQFFQHLFANYLGCVAIGSGYYGSRQVGELYQKLAGCQIIGLEDLNSLQEGDMIHLETPLNPNGKARSNNYFADEANNRGAYLVVDSTFRPRVSKTPFPYALVFSRITAQNTSAGTMIFYAGYYPFHQQKKKRGSRHYTTSVLYSGLSLIVRRYDLDVFISYGDSQL